MVTKQDILLFKDKHRILLHSKDYICLLPHANLRAYISNYNITFPTKIIMPDSFTEMPCGCATLNIENDGTNIAVHLEGPKTRPVMIGKQANQLELLITVEFKPAGLYPNTGINQDELINETIPFWMVNSKLSKQLCEAVEKTDCLYELLANLDMLMLKNMTAAAYHPQLIQTLQSMVISAGNIDVKKLSTDVNYSERQLNRIFKQHIGISAKAFSRLLRINNAFRLIKKPDNTFTFISDVMGFYDLSHFIRDFKLVCGMSPQVYRENMSDFYTNPTIFSSIL